MAKLKVKELVTAEGLNPYREWLQRLDVTPRARVQARVLRFETGNLGDCRSVGHGISEARLDFGPGYRIYFGRAGESLVLLLIGGDKSTQSKDIRKAKSYWKEYLEATGHGKAK